MEKYRNFRNLESGMIEYLINRVSVDGGIKTSIEIVEKIDHLEGCRTGRDDGETNDIGKVDGNFLKFFRINVHS